MYDEPKNANGANIGTFFGMIIGGICFGEYGVLFGGFGGMLAGMILDMCVSQKQNPYPIKEGVLTTSDPSPQTKNPEE